MSKRNTQLPLDRTLVSMDIVVLRVKFVQTARWVRDLEECVHRFGLMADVLRKTPNPETWKNVVPFVQAVRVSLGNAPSLVAQDAEQHRRDTKSTRAADLVRDMVELRNKSRARKSTPENDVDRITEHLAWLSAYTNASSRLLAMYRDLRDLYEMELTARKSKTRQTPKARDQSLRDARILALHREKPQLNYSQLFAIAKTDTQITLILGRGHVDLASKETVRNILSPRKPR